MEPLKPADENYLVTRGVACEDIHEYNRLLAKRRSLDPDDPTNHTTISELETKIHDLYQRINHELIAK